MTQDGQATASTGDRPDTRYAHLGEALGTDFFFVREQFTDEQWSRLLAVRKFVGRNHRTAGRGPLVLDGAKRWIGNGTIADLVVVWARDTDSGDVLGFVVETPADGSSAEVITGKVSLRSVWQSDIALTGVRVPEQNRLVNARSFKDAGRVLAGTRAHRDDADPHRPARHHRDPRLHVTAVPNAFFQAW